MNKNLKKSTDTKITESQCKDAGMALVLLLLIAYFTFHQGYWIYIATAALVITMAAPKLIKPFARVWFYVAHFLGTYVSKVILFIVFYIVVTPVGLLRRLLNKDTLKLKGFKKEKMSVMDERNTIYQPGDITKPF